MGQTVFLADNLLNGRIYPLHSITAEEEPAGFEAWRVASGRREGTSYATASTANSDWWLKVVCDRLRAANVLVLDRGHNLDGKAVKLQWSPDNTVWLDIINLTALPSAPGGTLDAIYGTAGVWGAVTDEGAWIVRFPVTAAVYWRLLIPAMGAGLTPQIPGLWLGRAYETTALTRPIAEGGHQLVGEMAESAAGWLGFDRRTPRREGTFELELPDVFEYELLRLHLEGLYGHGRPMWIVWDDEQADDALLAILPPGRIGARREPRWFYHKCTVPYIEHEPLEAA